MNTAGTGFQCNVLAYNNQRITVNQRMLGGHILQLGALDGTDNFIGVNACRCCNRGNQVGSQNINLTIRNLHKGILKVRVQRNCQVARQGPGGGGPDYEVYVVSGADDRADLALIVLDSELHINGFALCVLVFNFSFSQSGLIMRAPVNRLQTLIDVALLCHFAKYFNLLCNKIVGQGQIRVFPVAYNAQTLELLSLGVDMLQCKFLTLITEILVADLMSIQAKCSNCLTLNRKAMGIPARNIRSLKASHILITDNEVLQNLVQRMTQMQIAVCIGRAVMQNEQRLALILLHQCIIDVVLFPFGQKFRLALRKTSAHRKISLRKIDCLIVILRHLTVPSFLISVRIRFCCQHRPAHQRIIYRKQMTVYRQNKKKLCKSARYSLKRLPPVSIGTAYLNGKRGLLHPVFMGCMLCISKDFQDILRNLRAGCFPSYRDIQLSRTLHTAFQRFAV